jgi:hypothetical protein
MPSLTIRLRVHESDRPLEGLLVSWYATSLQSLRKDQQSPAAWDKVRQRRPSDLKLVRLGSSVSDERGIARLEYQMAGAQRARQTSTWYAVRTPDLGQSCGRTIHVACELTPISDDAEEFSVRVPQGVLDRSAADRRSSATIDAVRTRDELEAVLGGIENAPTSPRAKPQKSFGATLRARTIRQRRKAVANGRGLRVLPSIADLELRSRGRPGAPTLAFDATTRQLTVRDPSTQRDVPVQFQGVRRSTSPGLTERQIVGPYVEVDETTGSATISLPKVPDELVAQESEPSELFTFLSRATLQGPHGNGARS